jgi:hypothetical protein
MSEVIAYSYDDFIPDSGETYSDGPDAYDMASIPDAIDLDVDLDDRYVSLLSSYNAVPDPLTGQVFLAGAAWDGSAMRAGVMSFDEDLGPGGDCAYEDGPFCWYRYWSAGTSSFTQDTDGAACLDPDRGIFVGSSITVEGEGSGAMQFFRTDEDGNLDAWLSESGGVLPNGPLAVTVVCH